MHDLKAWCEDWAKARGYWREPVAGPPKRRQPGLWRVVRVGDGFKVRHVDPSAPGTWTLTPLQFWLWAHAFDTDSPLARVACESMGPAWPKMPPSWQDAIAWLRAECLSTWASPPLAIRRRVGEVYKKHPGLMKRRRDRLNPYEYRLTSGDPAARLALGLHANELLHTGDPLGTALALWLHGVPCEACKGAGRLLESSPTTMAGLQASLGPGRTIEVTGCTSINGQALTIEHGGTIHVFAPCVCHGEGTALAAFVFAQLEHLLTRPDLIVPPSLDTTSP